MYQQLNSSRVRICARRFSGCCAILTALLLTLVAPHSSAQAACNVVYTISPQNNSAFGAAITIDNTGTTALSSWKLTWTFANGQTVSSLWNGIESQSGANVTVTNESYNGAIAAGGSLSGIGFNGTWNGTTNAVPTSFAVNGVTCGSAATGSFTLKPSASALSIAQGASGTDTITVTDVSPFTGSVTLAASGLPSGVTASFSANPTTGTSVVTFAASASATAGTSTVTITGTSGSLTAGTTIALTVTAASTGSFTLKPSASTLSIAQGASGTDTITVTDVSPFTGSVTLAASGLPSGVTASFSANPATATSVVTFLAGSTATAGTSTVTITGTSGTLTATTTISLTVTAVASFTIAPSATSISIAPSSSGTDTVTVTDVNGFTGSVTLAASGLPSGVTAAFGANPTTGSSVVTFTASSAAAAGTSTVTITGTSGSLSKTTTILLTVTGTAAKPAMACSIVYTASGQSVSGSTGYFGGAITIDNTGTEAWTNWTLTWTYANAQVITNLWGGVLTQTGANVSIVAEPYDAAIAAGGSNSSVGFNASWNTVTNAQPTNFAINGTTCSASGGSGFTLGASASPLALSEGSSSTDTIAIADFGGFTGSVTLAASGLPAGVTAAFGANPATGSSVVTFTAAASLPAGSPTVTITGASGSVTASTTITLNVAGYSAVTVNQTSTGLAVSNQILGMDMAAWYDIVTNETAVVDAFQTAGIKSVRWPGGSWSDVYHWATNTNCQNAPYGGGTPDTDDTFTNFVNDLAIPAGLDVALTADYGTNPTCTGGGLPSEAAAWVTAALADGITVSHMTVGNEVYGSTWEEDLHSPANNAAEYASTIVGSSGFYQTIKAASPKTLVGVVVDADNTTGGWDNTVLANAKGSYDFVEYHYYPEAPGEENDTTLIQQDAQQLTTNIDLLRSEMAEWGTPNTPIYVGEIGGPYGNPGKQSMSITQALYAGQVLGEMMNDGVTRLTWWIGFGGCADASYGANFSSSLYGWQDFGGYMVFSDGLTDYYECTAETLAAGTLLPTARAFQLFSNVAVNGEDVLKASVSGDTTDVVAYAATHSGGTALVLFNRNETAGEPVSITLSGQTTATSVTVETYDKAIYDLSGSPTGTIPDPAGTSTWAPPTTTTISSPTLPLTLTLAPWSMNVVIVH